MGFRSVCYDRDIWMQMCEDGTGYDYICTHVDDFKIVARDPNHWLTQISGAFLLKSTGPPSYYLGNDYMWSPSKNAWVLGCSTYIKECIRRLEEDDMIKGKLWEHKHPLPAKVHPEMDESPLLDNHGLKLYQTLIGMAQCNRNMSKSKGWTLQSSLLMLWMDKTRINNQTRIADNEKLTITH